MTNTHGSFDQIVHVLTPDDNANPPRRFSHTERCRDEGRLARMPLLQNEPKPVAGPTRSRIVRHGEQTGAN